MEDKTSGGFVLWITGLSGAGKTTIAKSLLNRLPPTAILLDGDEMRVALELFEPGYSYDDRVRLALTYGRWAKLLVAQRKIVVVATISMYRPVYEWNRENIPGYVEIFLDVPEHVRLARDIKKVYIGTDGVHQKNIAGLDVHIEAPYSPDIHLVNDETDSVVKNVDQVWQFLVTHRFLVRGFVD